MHPGAKYQGLWPGNAYLHHLTFQLQRGSNIRELLWKPNKGSHKSRRFWNALVAMLGGQVTAQRVNLCYRLQVLSGGTPSLLVGVHTMPVHFRDLPSAWSKATDGFLEC